jgi:hypothetical protein
MSSYQFVHIQKDQSNSSERVRFVRSRSRAPCAGNFPDLLHDATFRKRIENRSPIFLFGALLSTRRDLIKLVAILLPKL